MVLFLIGVAFAVAGGLSSSWEAFILGMVLAIVGVALDTLN